MTDSIHRQNGLNQQDLETDLLDRQLDAALSNYAAVEPRTGLEQRILANLRAEREHAALQPWWQWPAAGALMAGILLTAFIAWRSEKQVQNIAAQSAPTTVKTTWQPAMQETNHSGSALIRSRHSGSGKQRGRHATSRPLPVEVSAPKLDQFPSPRPLSEQEQTLARYVTKYPEHAALIAQARTEELLRDSEEAGAAANQNSPPWNK